MSDDGGNSDFWYVVRWTAVWGGVAAVVIFIPSIISVVLWTK